MIKTKNNIFEPIINRMQEINQNQSLLDDLYYDILNLKLKLDFSNEYIVIFNEVSNNFEVKKNDILNDDLDLFRNKIYNINLSVQYLDKAFYNFHIEKVNQFITHFYENIIKNYNSNRFVNTYNYSLLYKIATKTINPYTLIIKYDSLDDMILDNLLKNGDHFDYIYNCMKSYTKHTKPLVLYDISKLLKIKNTTLCSHIVFMLSKKYNYMLTQNNQDSITKTQKIITKINILHEHNIPIFINKSKDDFNRNMFKIESNPAQKINNQLLATIVDQFNFDYSATIKKST